MLLTYYIDLYQWPSLLLRKKHFKNLFSTARSMVDEKPFCRCCTTKTIIITVCLYLYIFRFALLESYFIYLNCGITLRNKVQKLQNRAARVLTYSSYDVDAGHLFKLLGWKNLACQQQITRATMVYRSPHGLAPNYLSSKFERREVACNLRDSENKLNVPLPHTNYYKNSFSCNLNDYSKNCKARHSWKAAFYFYYISIRHF